MKQNKFAEMRKTKKILLAVGVFALVFATTSSAGAQEMIPVVADSVGANVTLGTPVSEIISAAGSGGLSGAPDLSALKPGAKDQPSENSISSNQDPSGFNSDSLKNLELKGGLSSDPQISTDTPSVFNLAVKFFEKAVFKKDVEFAGRPIFEDGLDISGKTTFDKDTAGYAIIKKDNQSVMVEFDKGYDSPPIVTATLSLQQYKDSDVRALAENILFITDVKYIITNVSKKGFEIMMDKKADSDIPFSWHALAVNDPTTSKKKGETLKSKIGSEFNLNASAASSSIGGKTTVAPAAPAPAAPIQPGASQTPVDPAANGNAASN
ncbi:MAG: hypothetical protein NT093_03650 [Candidatus Moranbacteria bacterium]|nr:hypothetical protein [Candidatus Moranbacteria bacterium]